MHDKEILANEAQLQNTQRMPHEPAFDAKEIANLHVFLLVFLNRISRTCPEIGAFTPTVDQLKYTIDSIRGKERVSELTSEWQYGYLLSNYSTELLKSTCALSVVSKTLPPSSGIR